MHAVRYGNQESCSSSRSVAAAAAALLSSFFFLHASTLAQLFFCFSSPRILSVRIPRNLLHCWSEAASNMTLTTAGDNKHLLRADCSPPLLFIIVRVCFHALMDARCFSLVLHKHIGLEPVLVHAAISFILDSRFQRFARAREEETQGGLHRKRRQLQCYVYRYS